MTKPCALDCRLHGLKTKRSTGGIGRPVPPAQHMHSLLMSQHLAARNGACSRTFWAWRIHSLVSGKKRKSGKTRTLFASRTCLQGGPPAWDPQLHID